MASVDFLGVAEVWLHLFAAGIKPPLMDATGFDEQNIVAELRSKVAGRCGNEREKHKVFLQLIAKKMIQLCRNTTRK